MPGVDNAPKTDVQALPLPFPLSVICEMKRTGDLGTADGSHVLKDTDAVPACTASLGPDW